MKQARVLTRSELKRVLAICSTHRHHHRNRLIILLSHYAGLRVGEIASLVWSDLLEANGSVKHVFYLTAKNTKSNEARAIHLNELLMKEIANYLKAFGIETGGNMFSNPVIASQKGKAFSANSLCQLFGRIYLEAGINDASSHSGRRWFITQLAHAGVSPKVIMELAGHKHLGTTQRYIEVNEDMKTAAVGLL
ncbi:MAG: site-specific integrase [Lentilitoribacter sp.]